MKIASFLARLALVGVSCLSHSQAAVIEVSGVIETVPGNFQGLHGETIDYLKFEMLSTGPFSLKVPDFGQTGRFYTLAVFTGDNTQFGPVSSPSVLGLAEYRQAAGGIPTLSRTLEAGTYIMIVDAFEDSQYDFGDGFVPVNRDGGFFPSDPYSFTIQGDVRPLELWEGLIDPQPNGSFKITTYPIPEPSTWTMIGLGLLVIFARQSQIRKTNV